MEGRVKIMSRPLQVGVDVGGTKIAALVAGAGHEALGRAQVPTDIRTPERTLDGTATKLNKVKQSDVFVVVLRGKMLSGTKRRAMLIDLLPAGFEVENARLAGSRGSEQLGWLGDLTKTRYSEYLDDRFVAAFDLDRDNQDFAVAYLVRAVTPGTYRQPAAHVEDMYDPATRARTTIGSVTVRPFK